MSKLKQHYKEVVAPQLQKQLGCNIMRVPKITKVTLNMGLGGKAMADRKVVTNAIEDLSMIAGQRAVATLSRKSIAGFKLRAGWPIGCKVTLRKDRMYDFLERLLSIAIPRVRDFRGLSRHAFDKQGNYSMGIKEQIVFPEIKYDKIDALRGLDITISTTATNKEEGLALLQALNFPIRET